MGDAADDAYRRAEMEREEEGMTIAPELAILIADEEHRRHIEEDEIEHQKAEDDKREEEES